MARAVTTVTLQTAQESQHSIAFNAYLRLSPPELEAEFWRSSSSIRLLKAFDLICLCNGIFTHGMLIRTFGLGSSSGMSYHHLAPTLVYLTLAILQLGVLLLAPAVHQRYRFPVTLVNRLLRLATLSFAAYNSSPSVMARMTSRVNSPSRTNPSQLMKLIRPVVGPPLVYLNHCNFVLPFAWVLPFQLWTLAACSMMIRSTACVLAESETYIAMAAKACTMLKTVMHYGSMLLGGPAGTDPANAASVCSGVEAILLLLLYVHVIVLGVAPLLVIYFVELRLKANFVQLKTGSREAAARLYSPLADSVSVRAVVAYACVLGAFFACHAVVMMLSPLNCTSRGLVSRRLQPLATAAAASAVHVEL